jgi:hypothetical protein
MVPTIPNTIPTKNSFSINKTNSPIDTDWIGSLITPTHRTLSTTLKPILKVFGIWRPENNGAVSINVEIRTKTSKNVHQEK